MQGRRKGKKKRNRCEGQCINAAEKLAREGHVACPVCGCTEWTDSETESERSVEDSLLIDDESATHVKMRLDEQTVAGPLGFVRSPQSLVCQH